MKPFTSVLLATFLCSPIFVFAQQEPAPAAQGSGATPATGQSSPSNSNAKSKSKDKPLPTFLIIGTIFNEKALSFPGVEVWVRRSDEKKFRWRTETNSRGEFAVRVPPGYEYEVAIHMKKYKDQTKTVDSKADVQQRLSIELEPVAQKQSKTGAKP
jgi:carboxypeptidase family protein